MKRLPLWRWLSRGEQFIMPELTAIFSMFQSELSSSWLSERVLMPLLICFAVQQIVAFQVSAKMQPVNTGIIRLWDQVLLGLHALFDYPELPRGWTKWRPVSLNAAIKALPAIFCSLFFMGVFTMVTMLYGWNGFGNPKFSFGAHVTVITCVIGMVAFARLMMVKGVKTWHGLR